jgi:hypothetical protein
MLLTCRGVAWTTQGQNPCDFRRGPGWYGGGGYRASSRTDVPLGRCPRHTPGPGLRHTPFGPSGCWRFSVFFLSTRGHTSTLWAKAGVPASRLRSPAGGGVPPRSRAAVLPVLGRFVASTRRRSRSGRKPAAGQSGGFETRARFKRIPFYRILELALVSLELS